MRWPMISLTISVAIPGVHTRLARFETSAPNAALGTAVSYHRINQNTYQSDGRTYLRSENDQSDVPPNLVTILFVGSE
jgi:hypothetical protein